MGIPNRWPQCSPALRPFLWKTTPRGTPFYPDLSRLADIAGIYWVTTARAFGFLRVTESVVLLAYDGPTP